MSDLDKISPKANAIFEEALSKADGTMTIVRKDDGHGSKLIAAFESLRQYESVFVHSVTEVTNTNGSFVVMLLEKHLTIDPKSQFIHNPEEVEEIEPVLVFHLKSDIGKVFLKEETLGEKIADLFIKIDIDFPEFPNFSSSYFMVGEKPELVKEHFPRPLLEALNIVKGLSVEINGTRGLIRPEKTIDEDMMLKLLHIGYRMTV